MTHPPAAARRVNEHTIDVGLHAVGPYRRRH